MKTTRILGQKWYDLGSDVGWQKYGGCWGRPMPTPEEPDLWAVIRLDRNKGLAYAIATHVRESNVTREEMNYADVPLDGLDEWGQPLPAIERAADRVRAYIYYWGANGVAGGETFSSFRADCARAAAARYLT